MSRIVLAMAIACALISDVASAHAHLHSSGPANHSAVAVAPRQLTLEFNEAVQLTAVSIQQGDGPLTRLGPLPAVASRKFALAVPALAGGTYAVKWRALSDDGHIAADQLVFTVGTSR